MRLSVIDSAPPHHVGRAEVAWDEFHGQVDITLSSDALRSGELPSSAEPFGSFLNLAETDAQRYWPNDNTFVHHLTAASDGFIPQSYLSARARQLMLNFATGTSRASAMHIDIGVEGLTYLASNITPTIHGLGKFVTFGAGTPLRALATSALLVLQANSAMVFQALPGEAVRIRSDSGVHASPPRKLSSVTHHVFVRDIVLPVGKPL